MSEELKKMFESCDNDVEKIDTPSREIVEEYLDSQIKMWEQVNRLAEKHQRSLTWGDLFDGEYSDGLHFLSVSSPISNNKIHMYNGIDKLAEILGVKLRCSTHDMEYPYMYSFDYKGYEIFQINKHRFSEVDS